MKRILLAALMLSAAAGALAQISIPLGNSGYYGRIDLGNLGAPPVIYQEPMLIERARDYRPVAPMYLRVPPGHAKKWSKHCSAYNACNRPVYFVQDSWYNDTYAPHYRRTHGERDDRDYNKEHRKDLKEREKDRREFYKEQDKDRREAEKEYNKDRREAQKEYDKDRKEAEKDRREAQKELNKERKERYKDH